MAKDLPRGRKEYEHADWLDVREGAWLLSFRRERSDYQLFDTFRTPHEGLFVRQIVSDACCSCREVSTTYAEKRLGCNLKSVNALKGL